MELSTDSQNIDVFDVIMQKGEQIRELHYLYISDVTKK